MVLVASIDGLTDPDTGKVQPWPDGQAPTSLAGLLEVGATMTAAWGGQLVVSPDVRQACGLPERLPPDANHLKGMPHGWVEQTEGWDLRPAGLAWWMSCYADGQRGHGVELWFPEWHPDEMFAGADTATLTEALGRVPRLLAGVRFRRLTGTAVDLMHAADRRRRSHKLTGPARMPEPITRRQVTLTRPWAPAQDIPEGWRVAALDVNAQFHSATQGTEFGVGEPEHHDRPAFDRKRPGIWRVRMSVEDTQLAPELPPVAVPAGARRKAVDMWLTTPVLTLHIERGRDVEIIEAWLSPDRARVFDRAGEVITAALDTLRAETTQAPTPALRLTLAIVKSVYGRFFGGYLGSDFGGNRKADDVLARRDWWYTIRGSATARMHRAILRAVYIDGDPRKGRRDGAPLILAVETDTVYLAVPAIADLDRLGEYFTISPQNGKWKRVKAPDGNPADAEITADIVAVIGDRKATTGQRVRALASAVKGS